MEKKKEGNEGKRRKIGKWKDLNIRMYNIIL